MLDLNRPYCGGRLSIQNCKRKLRPDAKGSHNLAESFSLGLNRMFA